MLLHFLKIVGLQHLKLLVKIKVLLMAIFVPQSMGVFALKTLDELPNIIKPYGGKGVAWFKCENGTLSGGISKLTPDLQTSLATLTDENIDNGTWFFIADNSHKIVHDSSDALRRYLGRECKLIKENDYQFAWDY